MRLLREEGARWDLALALAAQGGVLSLEGERDAGLAACLESETICRELPEPWCLSIALVSLGFIAFGDGDYAQAESRFQEALRIRRELKDAWNTAEALNLLGETTHTMGKRESAAGMFTESFRLYSEVGDRMGAATALENLAAVTMDQQQDYQAVRLYGVADRWKEKNAAPFAMSLVDPDQTRRNVIALRERLGAQVFEEAWEKGRSTASI